MKNIVIVGSGFAGLRAALELEKKFKKNKDIKIILVDKNDYHLFSPNLFEVASSDEELVSVSQIKKSITIPLEEIFAGKSVQLLKGEMYKIDPDRQTIQVGVKNIQYDYLILGLGLAVDSSGIEGLSEQSLPLNTLSDAFRIRNQIEFAVQSQKLEFGKKNIEIIIIGGGYTGVELAASLNKLLDFVAWKNQYPREKIQIRLVEAESKLLYGIDSRLSKDVYSRLLALGVRVDLSAKINFVRKNYVELVSGEKKFYDVLIQTMGKKVFPLSIFAEELDESQRVKVNQYLQFGQNHNIFIAGGMAGTKESFPNKYSGSIPNAISQGKYIAYALPFLMRNKLPKLPYKNIDYPFIISLGGKWTIFTSKHLYFKGLFAYIIEKCVHFRYYASILGWQKAIKYLIFEMEIFGRND